MKVLGISPAFYPATYWGGPIASLHGLYNSLARLPDIDLRVLTTDAAGPQLSQRVQVDAFPSRYPAGYQVYFCRRRAGASFAPQMLAEMPTMIRWADVVHLTGVYSAPTIPALAICRLAGRPVVWSPRGALQRWEASSRPQLKAVWDLTCRQWIDKVRTVIHATSEEEAAAIRLRIRGVRVQVMPNGVDASAPSQSRSWMPANTLRLLYLGRLHPIKGIENLLHALARLRDMPYVLRICGVGDSGYAEALRDLVRSLQLQELVHFVGEVVGDRKHAEFESADVCVVPSHSENFGMVVAESLAHGVPVIAARGTPWQGVVSHACGYWVDNDPDSLAKAVRRMKREDLEAMGRRGRAWMADSFAWSDIARRMRECYAALLAHA